MFSVRWVAVALLAVVGPSLIPSSSEATTCASVPFKRFDGGYSHFRVPALVRTTHGTLLAFAEGRLNSAGDTGDIDLVLRRSADGGCTWGRLIVVADHGGDTIGNPAPVFDVFTGRVELLATGNGGLLTERAIQDGLATARTTRRVYRLSSADEGETWSEREITGSVKLPGWRWYATGPGHGVQLRGGRHGGRLVLTGVHSAPPVGRTRGSDRRYSGTQAIISDDHGVTWRLGFVDDSYDGRVNTNETAVAQLPDGRLYFNSRDQFGAAVGTRAIAYSDTGGSTLSGTFRPAPRTAAPVVQCSVLAVGSRLWFAGPSSMDGTRSRLTVRSADDLGTAGGFTPRRMIWNGFAAYSDLVALPAGMVGVLYERGRTTPYDEIAFQAVV